MTSIAAPAAAADHAPGVQPHGSVRRKLSLAKLFVDQALPSAGLSGTLVVARALEARGVDRSVVMAAIIRTGWFVESLLTELVVALVVRTRRPFFASRPGNVLLAATLAVTGDDPGHGRAPGLRLGRCDRRAAARRRSRA